MPDEIEIKFRVSDFETVGASLRRLGAKYQSTILQTDRYLDTPDRGLMKRGCAMRLREAKCLRYAAGHREARPQLTFKGPQGQSTTAKIRREIQTCLDDPAAILDILVALGYRPLLTVQKRRAVFKLGRCEVELDELPLIGRFVEIEGSGEPQVQAAAKRLGLQGPTIITSYVHMIMDHCRQAGIDADEFTFEKYPLSEKHSASRE